MQLRKRKKAVTSYFRVGGKHNTKQLEKILYRNCYISRKVAVREYDKFKYCFRKPILSHGLP